MRFLGWCGLAAVLASGCGDDGGGQGGGGESAGGAGGAGAGGDPTPEESCIKPGDTGNDKGVGEYCTPTGGQCVGFPEAPLCLASVGQDQWFCSRIMCDASTDCGEGAGCLITGAGSACVPCKCDDSGVGCPGNPGGAGGEAGAAGGGGVAGGGGAAGGD